jgi:oligoendopeptidase F
MNEYGRGLYGFVHKTFQEYFTAVAIQTDARYEFQKILTCIETYLHQPHWQEVILLLVAQQEERGAADVIEAILNHGSDYEQWLHRDLLCAAQCLTEDPKRLKSANPELVNKILDQLVLLATKEVNQIGSQVSRRVKNCLQRLRNTAFETDALGKLKFYEDNLDRFDLLKYQIYLGEKQKAIETFISLLKDDDSSVRSRAAALLGQLGNISAEVMSELLNLLKDNDPSVRFNAVFSLIRLGNNSTEVVPKLLNLLKDNDSSVRFSAVFSLTRLGNTSAEVMSELLNLLKDNDSSVRSSAAVSLVQLGNTSTEVMSELLNLLKDNDSSVRSSAFM